MLRALAAYLRAQLSAAPLKHPMNDGSGNGIANLRAQLSAAPLKRDFAGGEMPRLAHLRAQLSAAPLKPASPRRAQAASRRPPRSIERGPVEALFEADDLPHVGGTSALN